MFPGVGIAAHGVFDRIGNVGQACDGRGVELQATGCRIISGLAGRLVAIFIRNHEGGVDRSG